MDPVNIFDGWEHLNERERRQRLFARGVNTRNLKSIYVRNLTQKQAEELAGAVIGRKLKEGRIGDLLRRKEVGGRILYAFFHTLRQAAEERRKRGEGPDKPNPPKSGPKKPRGPKRKR